MIEPPFSPAEASLGNMLEASQDSARLLLAEAHMMHPPMGVEERLTLRGRLGVRDGGGGGGETLIGLRLERGGLA